MKNYFLVMALLCTNLISGMVYTTPVPIIIDNREKKITTYSVQWLYDLYEQSPEYIITHDVYKNRSYFKHMMRNYVNDLSLRIEQQNSFIIKGALKESTLFAISLGILAGSWMLYQMPNLYKKNINLELVYMAGGMASTMVGAVALVQSMINSKDLITYKRWLARRYDVGKKILAQLEQADNTVYQ